MNLHLTNRAGTLAELSREIYAIPEAGSAAGRERAVEALLRANPHLGRTERVAVGTPLLVPDVEGLPRRREGATSSRSRTDLDRVEQALKQAGQSIDAALAARLAAERVRGELLHKHQPELISADASLDPLLAEAGKHQAEQLAALEQDRALQEADLGRLSDDLQTLRAALESAERSRAGG